MIESIVEIVRSVRPEIDFSRGEDVELYGVLDSFDVILIVEEIEDKFGVLVDAESVVPENFTSVKTLKNLVQRLQK